MDTRERDELAGFAQALKDKADGGDLEAIKEIRTIKRELNTFCNEHLDTDNSAERAEEWRFVSTNLWAQANDPEYVAPYFTRSTLPGVRRPQKGRQRLEVERFMLVRQMFSDYEDIILQSQAQQFFGLTGPQGFGKSAFLHYFVTKYRRLNNDYLVVYIPVCPNSGTALERELVQAFYFACRIAQLSGYPQQKLVGDGNLYSRFVQMIEFARTKDRTILLVIDQMKNKPTEFFEQTLTNITDVHESWRVVVSSSMSHRFSGIFPSEVEPLPRYSQKLTEQEAISVAAASNVDAANLTGLPFQVVAEILTGRAEPLADMARDFGRMLFRTRAQDDGDSNQRALFYLNMAADGTQKAAEEDCDFDDMLNPDDFYVEKDLETGRFFIEEHRPGYAAAVLRFLRSRTGDYRNYLLLVMGNVNFSEMDAGAQGRIVEDCFFVVLKLKPDISFKFSPLPPNGTNTKMQKLELKKATTFFYSVNGGDEAAPATFVWVEGQEFAVFFPQCRSYKGIDFIIAKRTAKEVVLYFIQCTIQKPQAHPICESTLYQNWHNLLSKNSPGRHCRSCLMFLTQHSTNLNYPSQIAKFFRPKSKYHACFSNVECADTLLDRLKERFPGTVSAFANVDEEEVDEDNVLAEIECSKMTWSRRSKAGLSEMHTQTLLLRKDQGNSMSTLR